jgi:hypothetical protein
MEEVIGPAVRSSYTIAYRVLLDAQKRRRRRLRIRQVQEYLESTPGLVFCPGTTVDEVLEKLERWELIEIDGPYVSVVGHSAI